MSNKGKYKGVGAAGVCAACGANFVIKRNWQKFCSSGCRMRFWLSKETLNYKIKELEVRIAEIEKKLK